MKTPNCLFGAGILGHTWCGTVIRETGEERGLAALVASRKARLWDAYVARWQKKSGRESRGLIDAFMLDFAKFYDREGE